MERGVAAAAQAAAAVAEAHKTIGRLASNAYIMGGSMSDIQPLLSANGPQDLIDQLSTLSTLGAQNSVALAQFKEAEAAARKAKAAADAAKAVQQVATDKVAFFFPPKDKIKLSDLIKHVLSLEDSTSLDERLNFGQKRYQENFTFEIMIKKYESTYEEL